jgi:hypothetical protein
LYFTPHGVLTIYGRRSPLLHTFAPTKTIAVCGQPQRLHKHSNRFCSSKQRHHLQAAWTVERVVNARAMTSMEECVDVQNSGSLQTAFATIARLHSGSHLILVTDDYARLTVPSLPVSTRSHLKGHYRTNTPLPASIRSHLHSVQGHRRSHPLHLAPSKTHASSGITVHAGEAAIATDRTRFTRHGQSHLLLTSDISNLARSHSALFGQICLP